VTLNSVELSRTDLQQDGRIQLELPDDVIRRLSNGYLSLRLTVVPCPPEVGCGPRGNRIAGIRIEQVHEHAMW
jgi:hypothetical protein